MAAESDSPATKNEVAGLEARLSKCEQRLWEMYRDLTPPTTPWWYEWAAFLIALSTSAMIVSIGFYIAGRLG